MQRIRLAISLLLLLLSNHQFVISACISAVRATSNHGASACTQFQIRLPGGKGALINLAIGILIAFVYHTFFESSKLRSRPGKLLFKFAVTDLQGERLRRKRAFARHFSKYASAFTLGLGYMLCFVSKKKQCLHDMLSGCVFVQE